MEMLTRLANEGISHDEIAQVCLSSVVDAPPPQQQNVPGIPDV